MRNNRPAFSIGEEPLGKIRGHDMELYVDVERPYLPMLRRRPYPASLETRKEIEKHITRANLVSIWVTSRQRQDNVNRHM
ncbi:hypothetical protein O181_035170 [Austropuccinia psidii MF-1]|uniref:Uncharacterized protein n=1 Tax=Austropuccinia psidii MF-1 TaxID=1389203 RepID=A0A9Q3D6D4_9BASI|nr:hypothetical protein [Austropuccinia psidii MF-1]